MKYRRLIINHSRAELYILWWAVGMIIASALRVSATYPGELDITFQGGRVMTLIQSWSNAQDIVIQPDGKIVAVGSEYMSIALARYNANGSLDLKFGAEGKVLTSVGQFSSGSAAVIQPDGRIVVAGSTCGLAGNACDFAVVRHRPNGSLDRAFDRDGRVTLDMGNHDFAADLVLQPDGKIVVVGGSGSTASRNISFAVARLNADGSLDRTFGSEGKVITSLGLYSDFGALGVALQPDGKIIVAGERGTGPGYSPTDFALVRYNADGTRDITFDGDGIVITNVVSYREIARDVLVQPDGRIVVVGDTGDLAAVLRYLPDGTPDNTFGTGGIALTDLGNYDFFTCVALQPNGKIVTGGYNGEHVIARFNPTGTLDAAFGNNGIVTTDFDNMGYPEGYPYGGVSGVAIQPDGKIIGAGSWGLDGEFSVFALARYIGDPVKPTPSP